MLLQSNFSITIILPFFLNGLIILILLITLNCSTNAVESSSSRSIWYQNLSFSLLLVKGITIAMVDFNYVLTIIIGLSLFCSLPIFIPKLHQ